MKLLKQILTFKLSTMENKADFTNAKPALRLHLTKELINESADSSVILVERNGVNYLQILIPVQMGEDTCKRVLSTDAPATREEQDNWRDINFDEEVCDQQEKAVTFNFKKKSDNSNDGLTTITLTAKVGTKIPGTGE